MTERAPPDPDPPASSRLGPAFVIRPGMTDGALVERAKRGLESEGLELVSESDSDHVRVERVIDA